MKFTTSTILAILASLASAEYWGNITTEGIGSCPMTIHAEGHLAWDHEFASGSNLCIPTPATYTSSYKASIVAIAGTPSSVAPTTFGGCTDSDCSDCDLVKMESFMDIPGERYPPRTFGVQCVDLVNAPYVYVGFAPATVEL